MSSFYCRYATPVQFDDMILESDGESLTALYFEGSRALPSFEENSGLPVFKETFRWLNAYFSGVVPDFAPPYRIEGLTAFRSRVLELLLEIPYGSTVTYGAIAKRIAAERGIERVSAQAVGGAVGWNPICIIIPCHRVVGCGGKLVGYGGGLKNKAALLALEERRG